VVNGGQSGEGGGKNGGEDNGEDGLFWWKKEEVKVVKVLWLLEWRRR